MPQTRIMQEQFDNSDDHPRQQTPQMYLNLKCGSDELRSSLLLQPY
ncbi:hypothetical protein [Chlorogloea sp. CCALA 695]|nr:hypothetical protein [Chlorogloea sp. CCALA 695]